MIQRLTGLIAPPRGFVSSFPPLLGAPGVPLLSWDEIEAVAKSGKMDGHKRYGSKFCISQKHSNCASASGRNILCKTIYDRTNMIVNLSDCFLYSLVNSGRDEGAMLADVMLELERSGICLMSTCGQDDIFRNRYDTRKADEEAKRFRAQECYAIRASNDTETTQRSFWSALCLGFKVGVAVQAGSRFDRLDSNGICGVDGGGGNHAVTSDGIAWAGGQIVATSENSWGLGWGANGRMNLIWKHFVQTCAIHEFYAARSATDDPLSENPPEVAS